MGTHPIFESDFDCLTEMSRFLVSIKTAPRRVWSNKYSGILLSFNHQAASGIVKADKNGEDFVIGRRSFENYEQLPRFELKPGQPVEFNENFTHITGPNGEPLLHTKKPFFIRSKLIKTKCDGMLRDGILTFSFDTLKDAKVLVDENSDFIKGPVRDGPVRFDLMRSLDLQTFHAVYPTKIRNLM